MPPRPGLSTGPCPGVAWCAVAWLAWHGERAEPAGHALHLPRAAGHRPSRLSHHLAELRFVRTSEGFSAPTSQRDLTVFTDRPPPGTPSSRKGRRGLQAPCGAAVWGSRSRRCSPRGRQQGCHGPACGPRPWGRWWGPGGKDTDGCTGSSRVVCGRWGESTQAQGRVLAAPQHADTPGRWALFWGLVEPSSPPSALEGSPTLALCQRPASRGPGRATTQPVCWVCPGSWLSFTG